MRETPAVLGLLLTAMACAQPAPEASPRLLLVEKGPYQAYYGEDGRILRLLYDANGDGRADIQTLYDLAGKPVSAEADTDHDGVVDRWEAFASDGSIEKIGVSRLTPGRPDAWTYAEASGADRREGAVAVGSRVREARDTDGDGRPDVWLIFEHGRLAGEELDTDGDAKPDRRLQRGQGGEITAIETDQDEDGVWEKTVNVRR